MLRTLPPDALENACITLLSTGSYQVERLVERLLLAGYTRSSQVEGPGQFALRGGILDVYSPLMEEPVRCEFFDDEVDSLGSFDTVTSGSSLYIIQFDSFYTPSVNGTITPCLTYELDSEMIGFYLINDNCTVVIFFDKKLDGTYEVFYKDNNVDALYGTIYASTYVQGTTLDYSYYPGQSTLTKATDMTSLLIYKLDTLYKSIGITAYDLGFKAYK